MSTTYKIIRAVLDDGTPAWKLLRTFAGGDWPFGGYSVDVVAINTDRSVIEKAKEHLEGSDTP